MAQAVDLSTHYDVIIVGGRPAGASLAARLGQRNIKTLIVEQATFPSKPAVSTPFVWAHTMELLDEIGVDEADYARNTPQMTRAVLEFGTHFRTFLPISERAGRSYMYTVERARFDEALWKNLDRFTTVSAIEDFSVTDLVKDDAGRVSGIVGHYAKQDPQTISADCVVGADGRFSTVARKAGAEITEQRTDVDTTIYYAFWENVAPYDEAGDALPHIHASLDGFTSVFMPTADNLVAVVAQGQSDLYNVHNEDVQDYYLSYLQQRPYMWRRLTQAKQVSKLSGMKRMGNLFREAAGPGWALIGDAYHQKDSLDGQGIYDALLGAKFLAEEIEAWKLNEKSWDEAMTAYGERINAATKPMFVATLDRVKREVYTIPPPFVAKNVLRWMLTDPEYIRRFSLLLIRKIDPENWAPPPVLLKALASGIGSDLKRLFSRSANPQALPPIKEMIQ
ncbi:MAG: NAD(P)/FAD-dependent oxidoreductase [Chloroflexota bacterium]